MKRSFGKIAFTAIAALQFAGFAFAGGEGWITDFEAAKKQAAEEKKDLLVDFTGSDWCGWCIKLNKEVFSHEPFKAGVKDKFVLVELDYPQDKSKLSEATQAQNKELQKKYAISGFPTILLCDASGKPFAKTGYQEGGPEKYVASLDELRAKRTARDEAFAAAGKAEGVAKAKQLVAALKAMDLEDETVANFYGDVTEQIKAADPKDETGFTKAAQAKEKLAAFQKEAMTLSRAKNYDGAIALTDKTLKEEGFDAETKQQIAMTKATSYLQMGKFDEATKATDEAIAIAPESKIAKPIEAFKGRISKMKEAAAEKAAEAPAEKK